MGGWWLFVVILFAGGVGVECCSGVGVGVGVGVGCATAVVLAFVLLLLPLLQVGRWLVISDWSQSVRHKTLVNRTLQMEIILESGRTGGGGVWGVGDGSGGRSQLSCHRVTFHFS